MSDFTQVGPLEPGRLRVLLADQADDVRQKFRDELTHLEFVEIAGEAATDQEALNLALLRRPHVVIVSTCLPRQGGFEVLRCIKRVAPACAVILTSRYANHFVQQAADLLGAAGVCSLADGIPQLGELLKSLAKQRSNGHQEPPRPG